mmetsp:Transcript_8548/g.25165  ORF Transcript_8548/g.25165 Transcript_8548/m.25165 type:complete len:297 (-) Transcript_8548:36-926(-)
MRPRCPGVAPRRVTAQRGRGPGGGAGGVGRPGPAAAPRGPRAHRVRRLHPAARHARHARRKRTRGRDPRGAWPRDHGAKAGGHRLPRRLPRRLRHGAAVPGHLGQGHSPAPGGGGRAPQPRARRGACGSARDQRRRAISRASRPRRRRAHCTRHGPHLEPAALGDDDQQDVLGQGRVLGRQVTRQQAEQRLLRPRTGVQQGGQHAPSLLEELRQHRLRLLGGRLRGGGSQLWIQQALCSARRRQQHRQQRLERGLHRQCGGDDDDSVSGRGPAASSSSRRSALCIMSAPPRLRAIS